MIVTCKAMREIEEKAFAAGATAEALMDEAGEAIAAAVRQFHPALGAREVRVVFGKGHNGGDALVAARHLAEAGWAVSLREVFPRAALAPLTAKKLETLSGVLRARGAAFSSTERPPDVILDGLLGIGGKPGLREPIRSAAAEINRLRRAAGAVVFALDLPTGLDGDTGEPGPDTVMADVTLAVGFAKRGEVADAAPDFVGRLAVLPLSALTEAAEAAEAMGGEHDIVAVPSTLRLLLPRRRFSLHKGDCGRVGVFAGSRGLTGAAVMASGAAVRAGAGLVSLFVTPGVYPLVAAAAAPEVMVSPVESDRKALARPFDALALGPGLGRDLGPRARDLLEAIVSFPGPMVLDADALNLLAASPENLERLRRCAGPRLLTPHPGEMRRLFPEAASLSRRETARRFLARFRPEGAGPQPLVLLLKGARTLVAEADGARGAQGADPIRVSYNTTGHPGMATGGMGDILTGVCAALAGQGLPLYDAARLGAWVCGRAAEIALCHGGQSEESLCASDLPRFFGQAFRGLRGPEPVF